MTENAPQRTWRDTEAYRAAGHGPGLTDDTRCCAGLRRIVSARFHLSMRSAFDGQRRVEGMAQYPGVTVNTARIERDWRHLGLGHRAQLRQRAGVAGEAAGRGRGEDGVQRDPVDDTAADNVAGVVARRSHR